MDEKEVEARPVMGTIFLVIICTLQKIQGTSSLALEWEPFSSFGARHS